MRFSIIIPAYNASGTIAHCLDSVICQDFPKDDYEIIVVDDCSPDKQNDIIGTYAAKSNEDKSSPSVILIHHKENKRQGGARNTALKAAKGDWIIFLDADDYWRSTKVLDTFGRLINQYPEAEIFESSTYIPSTDVNLPLINPDIVNSRIKTPSEYYEKQPHPCIWAAAYARNLIFNTPFREKVYYEDTDWKIKVFTKAKKIATFDFPFYVYFQNSASTTSAKSIKAFEDAVTGNTICTNEWNNSGLPSKQIARILKDGKKYYISSILDVRNYKIADGRHLLKYLKESDYRYIVKSDFSLSDKLISFTATWMPLTTVMLIKTITVLKRILSHILH